MIYEIPLTNDGESRFNITLGDQVLYAITKYNLNAECWMIDLWAADETPLLSGVMLVPNVDILKAYPQLKRTLGSMVVQELNIDDYKDPDLLGSNVKLVWFPPGETI